MEGNQSNTSKEDLKLNAQSDGKEASNENMEEVGGNNMPSTVNDSETKDQEHPEEESELKDQKEFVKTDVMPDTDATQQISTTDEIAGENTTVKNLETADVIEERMSKTLDEIDAHPSETRSLHSMHRLSSKDSIYTTDSYKEMHGEMKRILSYEDLKESITPEESLPSRSSDGEVRVSDTQDIEAALRRSELVDQCKSLMVERRQVRLKNILLQKKLNDYFKKKKAEGTYREDETILTTLGGEQPELLYRKNLLVFEELLEKDEVVRNEITSESEELQSKNIEVLNNAVNEVEMLIQKEITQGKGLIDSRNGKIIPEEVVIYLTNRHRQVIDQLSETMLKFIRAREEVAEKETAIKALEVLGEGLHLIDYEQLCVEKRSLNDKLEERDNELTRLREKIETSILALSQHSEKANYIEQSINDHHHTLCELNNSVQENREVRTLDKKRLIRVRREIESLQHDAGLLIHPSLLTDFENILIQTKETELEVNQMKRSLQNNRTTLNEETEERDKANKFNSTFSSIQNGQNKRFDKMKENIKKELFQTKDLSKNISSKICKGRPSIAHLLSANN